MCTKGKAVGTQRIEDNIVSLNAIVFVPPPVFAECVFTECVFTECVLIFV